MEEDDEDGDGGGLESSSGSRFEFISSKLRFRGILANSGEYIVKNNDQHDYKHKKCENPRKRFGNADRNSPITAVCRSSTERESERIGAKIMTRCVLTRSSHNSDLQV